VKKFNSAISKLISNQAGNSKVLGLSANDIMGKKAAGSNSVTVPIFTVQYKTLLLSPKLYQNGTMIEPKVFPANNEKEPNIFELYFAGYPYYDNDGCNFKKEVKPKELPIKNYEINYEVIYVSNLDMPYGTIAGTSTLDKTLYTDALRICAVLAIVDKAHNTQSLIQVYPGFNKRTNDSIIKHIFGVSKPENLELSVVSGYYPGTGKTLQYIFDTIKELAPNNTPKLYNFPKNIKLSDRGLLLHNGELSCCDMGNVKNRKTNPFENITYSKYE